MKAVVSSLLPENIKTSLSGFADVFSLAPDDSVAAPVNTHPDMILSIIGSKAFLPKEYAEKNPELCSVMTDAGLETVLCGGERSSVYPHDTALNCAVGDGFIITRVKSTDKAILDCARQMNYDIIGVNQGYAGCSSVICGDSVITSDKGIFAAVKKIGRECLFVTNENIRLPGYDVGFIGGCGGFHDGVLYFFGNIDSVPCGKAIREFASREKIGVVCLSDDTLTDYGGIKFLK